MTSRFLVCLLALGLAGCSYLAGSPDAAKPAPLHAGWWHEWNDPELHSFMTELEQQSLTYKAAGLRIEEADALRRAAGASLLPSFDVVGAANRGTRSVPLLGGLSEAGGEAFWDLDLFGSLRTRAKAAEYRAEQARLEREDTLRTLRLELALTIGEQRRFMQEVMIRQQQLALLHKERELTQGLSQAGLVTGDDVAEVQARGAEAALKQNYASEQLAATRYRLARLLARKEPVQIQNVSVSLPNMNRLFDISATHIQARPDVAAARMAYLALQSDAAEAEAALWPRISLGGFYGVQQANGATQLAANPAWALSAGLTAPVLNFGQLRNLARAADTRAEAASLAYEDTVNRALEDVRTALSSVIESSAALNEARNAFEHQHHVSIAERERYQRGIVSEISALQAAYTTLERQLQVVISKQSSDAAFARAWSNIGYVK